MPDRDSATSHDGSVVDGSSTGLGDLDLVERARHGSRAAHAELWRRHAPAARRIATTAASRCDPDDLVAEAFARIIAAVADGGGPTGAFRPYLFATVRNLAISWNRAHRLEHPLDDDESLATAGGEETVLDSLDRGLVAQAYRSLPARWQEALWYSAVEGMPPARIAPLLGLSANGAAALTHRAREGLRQAWIREHLRTSVAEGECCWVLGRLGAHARDRLAGRDRLRIRSHLRRCPRCAAAEREARTVGGRLPAVLLLLSAGVAGSTALPGGAQRPTASGARRRTARHERRAARAVPRGLRVARIAPVVSGVVLTAGIALAVALSGGDRPAAPFEVPAAAPSAGPSAEEPSGAGLEETASAVADEERNRDERSGSAVTAGAGTDAGTEGDRTTGGPGVRRNATPSASAASSPAALPAPASPVQPAITPTTSPTKASPTTPTTAAPVPTATPAPTAAPAPIPVPTAAPVPTATPAPTATPVPTAAPDAPTLTVVEDPAHHLPPDLAGTAAPGSTVLIVPSGPGAADGSGAGDVLASTTANREGRWRIDAVELGSGTTVMEAVRPGEPVLRSAPVTVSLRTPHLSVPEQIPRGVPAPFRIDGDIGLVQLRLDGAVLSEIRLEPGEPVVGAVLLEEGAHRLAVRYVSETGTSLRAGPESGIDVEVVSLSAADPREDADRADDEEPVDGPSPRAPIS